MPLGKLGASQWTLGLNAPWKKSRQCFVHCRSMVDTVVVGTCSLGLDSTMDCFSSCPSRHREVNCGCFLSDCAFGTGKRTSSLLSCPSIHALLEQFQFYAWKSAHLYIMLLVMLDLQITFNTGWYGLKKIEKYQSSKSISCAKVICRVWPAQTLVSTYWNSVGFSFLEIMKAIITRTLFMHMCIYFSSDTWTYTDTSFPTLFVNY